MEIDIDLTELDAEAFPQQTLEYQLVYLDRFVKDLYLGTRDKPNTDGWKKCYEDYFEKRRIMKDTIDTHVTIYSS